AREVGLVEIHHDELRFLGEEPVPAQQLLLVAREPEIAHWRSRTERLAHPLKQRSFPLLDVTLARACRLQLRAEPFGAALHNAQIGDEQLELEGRRVPSWIDVALDVRDRGVTERADDMDQRVGVPKLAELLRPDALA